VYPAGPGARRWLTYFTLPATGVQFFCRFGRPGTKSSNLMRSITSLGTLGLAANLARDGLAVASIPTLSLARIPSGREYRKAIIACQEILHRPATHRFSGFTKNRFSIK
jgi:hypothetical protein